MTRRRKQTKYQIMKGKTVAPLTEKTTIEKTITDESPTVVAYRVGQLEKSITRFGEKLDGISAGFATHKDVQDAKYHAEREHEVIVQNMNARIDKTNSNASDIDKRLSKLESIVSWVAYLIIGLVITAVVSLVIIDKADAVEIFNVREANNGI